AYTRRCFLESKTSLSISCVLSKIGLGLTRICPGSGIVTVVFAKAGNGYSGAGHLSLVREAVDSQKRKMESKEQEALAARYQLIGLQEQLGSTSQRMQITEEKRNAVMTSLRQEEVAKIAAEGKPTLPPFQETSTFQRER
ncbi:MAG: hypothetical protein Q9184_006425, partial [Pyrenodesmia sp. 2 TL-2023]